MKSQKLLEITIEYGKRHYQGVILRIISEVFEDTRYLIGIVCGNSTLELKIVKLLANTYIFLYDIGGYFSIFRDDKS